MFKKLHKAHGRYKNSNKLPVVKTIMCEIKNIPFRINSTLDITEAKITNLKAQQEKQFKMKQRT